LTQSSALEAAEGAVLLAREQPQDAVVQATAALAEADTSGDIRAKAVALRALGLAARTLQDFETAVDHFERSIALAEAGGAEDLAREARKALAPALARTGQVDRAMQTLDEAKRGAGPGLLNLIELNRVAILTMVGRYEEALVCATPLIRRLRRLGDRVSEGQALTNRGLLYVYTGRFRQAEVDLIRAERIALEAGHLVEAANHCHNRGFAAARKGDLPEALSLYERAEERFAAARVAPPWRLLDRAEVLYAAGLAHEARSLIAQSLDALRAAGDHWSLAEALLLLADIDHLLGVPSNALRAAEEAAELFASQTRPGWAALARVAAGRARLALQQASEAEAAGVSEAAAVLDRMGLTTPAVEAHAVAGTLWLATDHVAEGEAELMAAARRRRNGPAAARLMAWEAEAYRRLLTGKRSAALAALASGLAAVEQQQASLAATELRSYLSVHAHRAATQGLRLVLETRDARRILPWMDRRRANGLRNRPARPPRDERLAATLAELRAVAQELASEAISGADPRPLVRRQAELERQVRERAWLVRGDQTGDGGSGQAVGQARIAARGEAGGPIGRARSSGLSVPDLAAKLGSRVLIELAECDGDLHAVILVDGRCRYLRVASAADVHRELDQVRFALRRLAYGMGPRRTGSSESGRSAGTLVAAARLDDLLFGPLRRWLGDRPVVLVPTGDLHAMPWAACPSLAGRLHVVAPSAASWLQAVSAPTGSGERVLVVAGPGLQGAVREVRAIARIHPSAKVLTGRRVTASAVTSQLEGCDVAHIAAHASFRADNSLWSCLHLSDGPLTVYDLEDLRRPPEVVVLSACQSGLSTVRPGDEVIGFVSALLGLGTRSVIASVLPVSDESTVSLMTALHRALAGGLEPAAALSAARTQGTDPVVAAAFVCFGAG
jgi:hypothetical protein